MSVITAKGKEAKESANKQGSNIDWKKVYIRLKDGESVRVRLLGAEDYVEYFAHGSYNLGIYTQACVKPTGESCAICEAAEAGDDWKPLRNKKRYLFAFADLDEQMIRFFDASKGQARGLIDTIDQYADDLGELAFILKRTGNKTETNYSLSPIIKLKKDDKDKFDKFADQEAELSLFEAVLAPRTREQQIEELQKAGFPVGQYFGVAAAPGEGQGQDYEETSGGEDDGPLF
jgi:hypothetical protein